jgi:hypothetical protein
MLLRPGAPNLLKVLGGLGDRVPERLKSRWLNRAQGSLSCTCTTDVAFTNDHAEFESRSVFPATITDYSIAPIDLSVSTTEPSDLLLFGTEILGLAVSRRFIF